MIGSGLHNDGCKDLFLQGVDVASINLCRRDLLNEGLPQGFQGLTDCEPLLVGESLRVVCSRIAQDLAIAIHGEEATNHQWSQYTAAAGFIQSESLHSGGVARPTGWREQIGSFVSAEQMGLRSADYGLTTGATSLDRIVSAT